VTRLRVVGPEDEDAVRELHGQGFSRNAIAREINRSPATVSKIAKGLGLEFDRSSTKEATAAVVADAASRRTALVSEMIDKAAELVSQISGPYTAVFPDKEGNAVETPLARITPGAARDLCSAVSSLSASILRLSSVPASDGAAEARSMLGDLARALDVAAANLPDAS